MLNSKICYFKLSGRNKEQIETLKEMMIDSYIELRDLNGIYYYQSFKEYESIIVPNHLITDDIVLIISYNRGFRNYDMETYIYSDGNVRKSYEDYDDMFIKNRGHISERDYLLKKIAEETKKHSYDELIKYKNSNLFESILEFSYDAYFVGGSDIGNFRDIIHYLDELSGYLKVGQNLDFPTFVSLFS